MGLDKYAKWVVGGLDKVVVEEKEVGGHDALSSRSLSRLCRRLLLVDFKGTWGS